MLHVGKGVEKSFVDWRKMEREGVEYVTILILILEKGTRFIMPSMEAVDGGRVLRWQMGPSMNMSLSRSI